jgi:hypothetical protein
MNVNCFKLWIVLQVIGSSAVAQSVQSPVEPGVNAHVSIVGALKYPGLKVGVDYQVIDKQIERTRKDGSVKILHKNRFVTANVGFYYHKDYNTNIFLQGGYQLQRLKSSGWFRTLEPQLGVSRTFIGGTVYKVSDDGSVTRKKWAGHFYLAPSLSFGFGKDFSIKNENMPLTIFTKVTLFTNLPYNNFIYARVMMEVGAGYRLTSIMKHSVKQKFKKK